MAGSHLIITDSDCIKEEGIALKKPVLVFGKDKALNTDDRKPQGIKQIGSKSEHIVIETSKLLENPKAYQALVAGGSPFGDGHAAERIVKAIRSHFKLGRRPTDFKANTRINSSSKLAQAVNFPQKAAV